MRTALACLMLLAVCSAFGQSQTSSAFEVASIKQALFPSDAYFEGYSSAGTCGKVRLEISGNRVALSKITLCGLISMAYDVQNYQIAGAPAWMMKREQSIYYELEAKMAGDSALTPDRAREMLRALLADRFQLKFHRETRELPVYALVVGKNGPKLTSTTPKTCTSPNATIMFGRGGPTGSVMTSCKPVTTTAQLAQNLTRETDRPVVDKTGLTGGYTFELHWSPENTLPLPDSPPSIFTAIQEQLGLKLEPQKAPVETLVIDRAEKPSPN